MRSFSSVVVLLLAMSGSSLADTYSVAATLGAKRGDGIDYDLNYSGFDQSRGALTSVTLRLAGTIVISAFIPGPNPPAVAMFGNTTLSTGQTLLGSFGPRSAPIVNNVATTSFNFSTVAFIPNGLASPDMNTFLPLKGGAGILNNAGASSDFSTLNLFPGPLTSIAYEFTPFAAVPEPASFAVLGAGLVGLGILRRARQKSSAL